MKKAVALTAMALTLTLGVNAQTVDVNGAAIQNVGTPTSATDAAVNGDVLNNATNISNNTTDIATNTADIATINDSLGSVNDSINIIKTAVAALPTGDASWTVIQDANLLNGWVNHAAAPSIGPELSYRIDAEGYVHIKGVVKNGTINTPIYQLPVGYRPQEVKRYSVVSANAFGVLKVEANGDVKLAVGSTAWVDLSGITFKID